MAIPSGSGTEVLQRGYVATQSTDVTALRWDGTAPTLGTDTYTVPANHIITVISVLLCETVGNAETFNMYAHDGTNQIWMLQDQALAAYATFVYNDKFVVQGGDYVRVGASAGDVDVYYSYLDQDWS